MKSGQYVHLKYPCSPDLSSGAVMRLAWPVGPISRILALSQLTSVAHGGHKFAGRVAGVAKPLLQCSKSDGLHQNRDWNAFFRPDGPLVYHLISTPSPVAGLWGRLAWPSRHDSVSPGFGDGLPDAAEHGRRAGQRENHELPTLNGDA